MQRLSVLCALRCVHVWGSFRRAMVHLHARAHEASKWDWGMQQWSLSFKPSDSQKRGKATGLGLTLAITSSLLFSSCQSPRPLALQKPKEENSRNDVSSKPLHLEGRLLIEVIGQNPKESLNQRENAGNSSPPNPPYPPSSPTPMNSATKRINAPFELDLQNSHFGELRLLGPLGTTAALVQWSQEHAQLQSSELTPSTQLYANLSHLMRHWLGADLPLEGMLRWLEGHEERVEGWQFLSVSPNIKTIQGKGPAPDAPWVNVKMILNDPAP